MSVMRRLSKLRRAYLTGKDMAPLNSNSLLRMSNNFRIRSPHQLTTLKLERPKVLSWYPDSKVVELVTP